MFRYILGAVLVFVIHSLASAALNPSREHYIWKEGVFSVPLEIKDNSGVARHGWPVTTGVPLPYGVIHETGALRLIDGSGEEIPCQFKALSRYWARDNSIRWVLLDFQIDLKANEKKRVYLSNDRPSRAISNPILINDLSDRIIVSTGRLKVIVSKRRGSLLEEVSLDGVIVLEGGPADGPSLRSGEVHYVESFRGNSWNTHGWHKKTKREKMHIAEALYQGGRRAPTHIEIETQGPMRAVILIRGRHLPIGNEKGILKSGLYNFTTRLHFYRGKTYIKIQHAIENSDRTQPQWNYLFREASLNHSISLGSSTTLTGGGRSNAKGQTTMSKVSLDGGSPGFLYQFKGRPPKGRGNRLAVPGGYDIGRVDVDGNVSHVVDRGKRGRFLDISDGNKGVSVAVRYLWEEAPRAIELSHKHMRVRLHADHSRYSPQESERPEYDLDFGERTIHDILYYFHDGNARRARVGDVAEAFEYPLFAYAPPVWHADTEAWYFEVSPESSNPHRLTDTDRHWKTPKIGFRNHGYMHGYNSGGHHESLNSGWLSFLRSGKLADLERNLVLSRWCIAHNPGWVYENNVLQLVTGKDRYSRIDKDLNDWNRLTYLGPKHFYLWTSAKGTRVSTKRGEKIRYRGGKTYLNRYKWLPDAEHYAFFRLFEYYYLTGDVRALDAIHGFVNWAVNYQHKALFKGRMQPLMVTDFFEKDPEALRRHHYSRIYTWMLYTTLAGYHATGSSLFDEISRWQVRRLLALLRHRHGQLTGWQFKRGTGLGFIPKDLQQKIRQRIELDILNKNEPVEFSQAQTWMESQGVMALHEAYKTYGDERILDGLWGLGDYFSHHVLYYPRLGMVNKRTSMPNTLFGYDIGKQQKTLNPQRHGRHIQMWPILYHYTGWPELSKRYQGFEQSRKTTWVQDWFLQTGYWERRVVPKRSNNPPEAIRDLRVERADRSGITLTWTSPQDDGPSGGAARYFVKYSDKPIVPFALTDNPSRKIEKSRIVREVEDAILSRSEGKKRLNVKVFPGDVRPETEKVQLWDPDWHKVNAFWMAEHVDGEPEPSPPGIIEKFAVQKLKPHNWFGAPQQPGLEILPSGTYYLAICSWDEDRNLSELSNVVSVRLP